MSQERVPKPGTALAELLDSVVKLETSIEREGHGGKAESEEALKFLIGKVIESNLSPDDVKFLSDRLDGAAENHQLQSDQTGHIALMLAHSANMIRQRFVETLRSSGIDQVKGETWTAKVIKKDPRLEIDWPTLKRDGVAYFQDVPMVNEDKVMTALASGIDVPGVKLHENYELEFFVEKKAAK